MGFLDTVFGGQKSSPSSVFNADFFKQLQGQAGGLATEQMGQVGPFAQQMAGQLGQQGQQFLGQLGQAGQQISPFLDQSFANQQVGALGGMLNRNLQTNLQGINAGSVAAGGAGSGRQGLAQGQAIGDTQLAFGAGASDILSQDLARRGNLAMGQAGIQAQSAMGGLGSLNPLMELGLSGFGAAFNPLMQASQVAGGSPTVLGGGSSASNGMLAPIQFSGSL